ncbi:hypothetical protein C0J52_00429 [Blattella germanica]|nr:hypothetical protein C0J52_00429 [Blattella germanica]
MQFIFRMNGVYVAFVSCFNNLNSAPAYGDLQPLHNAMSAAGIKYDIKAWDDPNVNWAVYSHIILTYEIDYDTCIDNFLVWLRRMQSLQGPKFFNSFEIVLWNYHKKYLLELEQQGIRLPKTVFLHDVDADLRPEVLGEKLKAFQKTNKDSVEVVVKNVVGAGGTSVWRSCLKKSSSGYYVLEAKDLLKLQEQLLYREGKHGVLVQEFLPSILTVGEWSLIYFNKQFSHAIIKKTSSSSSKVVEAEQDGNDKSSNSGSEFRVQNAYGGSFIPVPQENVPKNLVQFADSVLAKVSEPLLFARVDIVMSEDEEPCLMELEVLDAAVFLTEPVHGERYLKAILSM